MYSAYILSCVLPISELYINMTKEEKRKLYKCGKKFKQLEDIATWQHFYQENKKSLKKAGDCISPKVFTIFFFSLFLNN